jgi:hypothetical protein
MGEKQTRHHEAPMGSWFTSPKTLMAQSMRRTARMVQLGAVSVCVNRVVCKTYKHPSKNKMIMETFLFDESCAAIMAGTGAKRMMALKKTCSDPMMMHDFLLWSSHFPGGWHMLIHPTSDQMYHIAISNIEA